jgi:branched-chain amino acid transport system substrate-binding protein
MKKMKMGLLVLTSALLASGLALAKDAPKNNLPEVIKIGVAGPQSGDLASYGIPTARAAKMVVDQLNEKGGILGHKIELLVEDDVCKPEIATNTASKLVSAGANVVLGHICSGATKAALGIYKDAKIIVMSPSATNPELTQSGNYPNFYRTIASDDLQAKVGVDYALGKLKVKKIAVIHDKGDYGKGYAENAKKFLDASGGKGEAVLFEGITPGAVDYSAIVQKIKQSGAEAVIYGGYHPEASKIVTQMRKKKMKTFFISDDGVKDDTFIKVAGEFADGVLASGPKDVSALPLNVSARDAYKKAFNADPGAFYQEGYSAILALTNAIAKAGTVDYATLEKTLRSEYVDTPVGKISFDKRGDAIGVGFSMYVVKGGKYVEVK